MKNDLWFVNAQKHALRVSTRGYDVCVSGPGTWAIHFGVYARCERAARLYAIVWARAYWFRDARKLQATATVTDK